MELTMTERPTIVASFPESDIAVLTLDMPDKGANVLSRNVLEELRIHLDELNSRNDIAGLIVISGKPGQFIAGADLREFVASIDMSDAEVTAMSTAGQTLFKRLTLTPFVTVAAIDGICVGGGAELASWCDRRIMTDNPKTQFGFPEVKLGLFPGWGGTVRAPRIVGLSNAVEMITGGESISGKEAYAMGFASDVVPATRLLDAAIELVRDEHSSGAYKQTREQWRGPLDISPTELGFLGAAASGYINQHTKGQYPAPISALEVMLGGAGVDSDSACEIEAEGMAGLFGSPINRALLNIFFLMDRNKKDTGIAATDISPRTLQSVAVVGAGIMGAGIAAANTKKRCRVLMTDTNEEALQKGVSGVLDEVSYDREKKAKNVSKAIEFAPFIQGTTSQAELANCDLVIEAIVENERIKKEFFSNIEPQLPVETILASNTSTIPITRLAEGLNHPERFCGIHFFNPVRKMKLVEVIRGQQTSDETIATAVQHVKKLGKMPVVVNDGPGFLVNRLLLPYMNEALELVTEGVPMKHVEKASTNFGMPMGPLALYDMVGLDTALFAGEVLCNAFPDRFSGSMLLPDLVNAGRLGQKNSLGFYAYTGKKNKKTDDPVVQELIKTHCKPNPTELSRKQLEERLFLPMLNEATRILQEELVRDPRDVDLGMIFGTGFPPFKGGPMFWADSVGAKNLVESMKPYEALGPRYQPTQLLVDLAASGGKFYPDTIDPDTMDIDT